MEVIKFGTDGWRAIIADDYTLFNVQRVAEATARWMVSKSMGKAVIGHDCRFGGKMFAEATAEMLGAYDIKVYLARGFVSTPMVSLGVTQHHADMGIVITASHNPPEYNGFKLKSSYGGPTIQKDITAVENMLSPELLKQPVSLKKMNDSGLLEYTNLENMYVEWVEKHFDLDTIRRSGKVLAYDAMYGAGQNVIRRILPNAVLLHCDYNPSFMGQAPEPIHKNLGEFAKMIAENKEIDMGLATDGDADRIGMYNQAGEFIDSHRILLLLLHYLHNYQGKSGKVAVTFSVTEKMVKLAEKCGLPTAMTKIGFKYIAEIMVNEDVLVAGEESGGIAVTGHIPERDGIWIGLTLLEFMAKTGKSIDELLGEVYDLVGAFDFGRNDLHITPELKESILQKLNNKFFKAFGKYTIRREENMDGYKFHFDDEQWVMIRPSGTEPVLRVYAQAPNMEMVNDVLSEVCDVIQS